MPTETAIPSEYVQFCKDVAKLAEQYQLARAGLTFRPGYNSPWADEIQMHWEDGRHGASAHRVVITSTVTLRTEVA